ncbi:disulfide oxidoreductase [Candidatus Peregrinibacteria bacterium CG11_big_fil_rev_8_21_14_0_20_41_10]|nr:MAG: disulfide oxidoreductase [Candidatus Peregrinibacteria bacterium CG11_big_fil_rev_8_21_14_0_20_41_10]PJC38156.1 MAG: disulfide oxidoreductase [Candidatus Peregrinibacteria bacterium CG_4_9_14_0_2_um_filter_41_14]
MNTSPLITGDMIIFEVVSKYPETMEVFFDYGIHCVGCGMAMHETIEEGLKGHGMDPADILADLNWILEQKD